MRLNVCVPVDRLCAGIVYARVSAESPAPEGLSTFVLLAHADEVDVPLAVLLYL